MIGALLYLRITSLYNLLVYRVRRLRQPKYLVGAAATAAYFYFSIFRRLRFSGIPGSELPGIVTLFVAAVCVFMCAVGILRVAFAWASPPPTPGLPFSEPEIAFLFPAPLSRRMLIHFRLLSTQLALLFTSVLMAVVFNRYSFGGGNRVTRAIGLWVILATLSLHISGTNLAVARLKERGSRYLLWRIVAVAVIALYGAAVIGCAAAYANRVTASPDSSVAGMNALVVGLRHSSPLRWLILPFTVVFAPVFAGSMGAFALAIIPALGVLALHYGWVAGSEYRFEEGSIAIAAQRAAARSAALAGESPRVGPYKLRAQPGPFPLSSTGPQEIAFLWKNILSMRSSLLSRRAVLIAISVVVWMSVALRPILARQGGPGGLDSYSPVIVLFCAIAAAYTLLFGPQLARQDLRSDLPNADILKTFPVEGWRLALGELLAPAAILSLILWFLIIVCSFAVDSGGQVAWLTPGVRVTGALCMAVAAPVVCVVQLIIPNLLTLLFPGWAQSSRARGAGAGIELLGQRLILGLTQMVVALLVAAPGALVAALIIFSSQHFIGVGPAIALSALVVLPIVAGEAAVGLWLIGDRFEKFDPSMEIR
jgi:ABC-2 type transport system permease protein